MVKAFFALGMVAILTLSACKPSATPALPLPTATAVPPTLTTKPPAPTQQGRTLVVTSPADSGPGTLRQALNRSAYERVHGNQPHISNPLVNALISRSAGQRVIWCGYG